MNTSTTPTTWPSTSTLAPTSAPAPVTGGGGGVGGGGVGVYGGGAYGMELWDSKAGLYYSWDAWEMGVIGGAFGFFFLLLVAQWIFYLLLSDEGSYAEGGGKEIWYQSEEKRMHLRGDVRRVRIRTEAAAKGRAAAAQESARQAAVRDELARLARLENATRWREEKRSLGLPLRDRFRQDQLLRIAQDAFEKDYGRGLRQTAFAATIWALDFKTALNGPASVANTKTNATGGPLRGSRSIEAQAKLLQPQPTAMSKCSAASTTRDKDIPVTYNTTNRSTAPVIPARSNTTASTPNQSNPNTPGMSGAGIPIPSSTVAIAPEAKSGVMATSGAMASSGVNLQNQTVQSFPPV